MKRYFTMAMSLVMSAGIASAVEPVTVIPASAEEVKPVATPLAGDASGCGGSCCSSGCCQPSCCSPSCDDGCGRGGVYANIGLYWIQPNFESNMAFLVNNNGGDNTTFRDFRYGMRLAPQIAVGVVNDDGFGGRVRWWAFDQSASETIVNDGTAFIRSPFTLGLNVFSDTNPNSTFRADSDLSLQVWDFEATQELVHGPWSCILSGGLRYAHIAQNYQASITDTDDTQILNLASGHNFNGAGPTISIDGRRRLGNGGLSLYGLLRGSLLFGTAKENSYFLQTIGGVADPLQSASRQQADLLPIVETEVGAEFSRDMGGSRLLIQLGVVGQTWFGAGNAANSDNVGFSENTANLGFIGLTGRIGVGF